MKRILVIASGWLGLLLLVLVLVLFGAAAIQLASFEDGGPLGPDDAGGAPSLLLSRPLVAVRGEPLGEDALEAHLVATAHRRVAAEVAAPGPGEYAVSGREWRIGRRAFAHPDGSEPEGSVEIALDRHGRVASLRTTSGERVRTLALEPVVIGAFHSPEGRDRRRVPLDALPEHLTHAVLAIEDQRFFAHGGLDLRRIAGALVANWNAGRVVQGGSTLTQQLVKNLYLTRQRSLLRKLQEAPLALLLELRHDKREILEAYLNEVYLGQSGSIAIHGVDRAAEHWFGRPATALALHESALLAAMLRGPSLYSPRRDPDAARARRDLVLSRMHALGWIDDAALATASAQPLGIVERRRIPRSARYFTDHVAVELPAYDRDRLERGALRIHTSLDLRLQRIAERSVRAGVERLERNQPALVREDARLQAALVALDARSGDLLAMVGGRDYGRSQWNRASDAHRQPGSLFKAVAALAALAPGTAGEPPPFTLATLVEDAPITLTTPEGEWLPGNHDGEFRGPVTLREVVEHSLNVPMVRVGLELGLPRVVRAARRLGIESPLRAVPSLVLGTSEVTLLEMTRAYGVLAAGGWRAEPLLVREVRDTAGAVIERREPAGTQALDPAEAYLVTSALRGVVDRGTGAGVRSRGFHGALAGKTGTTDDYRDAWFIGYLPGLVVGVWVGFDDGTTLRHSGSHAALPIFTDFLRDAFGANGGRSFTVPRGVETATIVAAGGHRAGLLCLGEPEVFLAGTAPRERCSPWDWFARERLRHRGGEERLAQGGLLDATQVGAGPDAHAPREPRRLRLPGWLGRLGGLGRGDARTDE